MVERIGREASGVRGSGLQHGESDRASAGTAFKQYVLDVEQRLGQLNGAIARRDRDITEYIARHAAGMWLAARYSFRRCFADHESPLSLAGSRILQSLRDTLLRAYDHAKQEIASRELAAVLEKLRENIDTPLEDEPERKLDQYGIVK